MVLIIFQKMNSKKYRALALLFPDAERLAFDPLIFSAHSHQDKKPSKLAPSLILMNFPQ